MVSEMARSALALAAGDARNHGRDELLPDLYKNLSQYASWWDRTSGTSTDHILGLLASLMTNHEDAEKHFKFVIDKSKKAGFKPTLVTVSSAYAEMLLDRNTPGDIEKAISNHAQALELSTDLGMEPLINRLGELSKRLAESKPAGSSTHPDGLTNREVEVLLLIAAGQSNQQIADELFLSRYTIVRHVSNIFGKTGASNRAEATSYAHQQNLVKETT